MRLPAARDRLPVVALVLLLAAAGCRPRGVRVARVGGSDAEVGRRTYVDACARCHGVDGRGHGPEAATLAGPAPDLTTLAERHGGQYPRDYVVAVIVGERDLPAHGTRDMPVWRERFGPPGGATAGAAFYAQRRIQLLADHVESLQEPPAPR